MTVDRALCVTRVAVGLCSNDGTELGSDILSREMMSAPPLFTFWNAGNEGA